MVTSGSGAPTRPQAIPGLSVSASDPGASGWAWLPPHPPTGRASLPPGRSFYGTCSCLNCLGCWKFHLLPVTMTGKAAVTCDKQSLLRETQQGPRQPGPRARLLVAHRGSPPPCGSAKGCLTESGNPWPWCLHLPLHPSHQGAREE